MNFIIENQSFYKIEKIVQVKTYIKRLGKYANKGNELKGKIFVDINYYDSNEQDIFTTCQFDYNISIPDEINIHEVILKELKLEVIDNQGINCLYALGITGEKKLDGHISVEIKEEETKNLFKENTAIENVKVEQAKNEGIKQELQQEYDQMLQESLENRMKEIEKDIITEDITENRGLFDDEIEIEGQEIEFGLEEELTSNESRERADVELKEDLTIIKNQQITEIKLEKELVTDEEQEITEIKLEEDLVTEEQEITEVKQEKVVVNEKQNLKQQDSKEDKHNSKIEIITTKDKQDEKGFLMFFNAFPTTYYEIKTLYIKDESELNKISTDYNVSLETLYKGYDREHNTVIIKNEK